MPARARQLLCVWGYPPTDLGGYSHVSIAILMSLPSRAVVRWSSWKPSSVQKDLRWYCAQRSAPLHMGCLHACRRRSALGASYPDQRDTYGYEEENDGHRQHDCHPADRVPSDRIEHGVRACD